MKKCILLVMFVCISAVVLADDIIITKKSERLNVKIEEVGVDVVKYRRMDNLTGPLYSIMKSEIASVIYENGQVEVYAAESPSRVVVAEKDDDEDDEVSLAEIEAFGIYSEGRQYYYAGRMVSAGEMERVLKQNHMAAYAKYRTGVKLSGVGTGLLCIGSISTIAGVACNVYGIRKMKREWYRAGVWLDVFGVQELGGGIALAIVGGVKKHKSIDMFNNACAHQAAPATTYSIKLNGNGLGLAVNF